MTQTQFDRLLAWTMLGALNSEEIVTRLKLGRDLTAQEHEECHATAPATALVLFERIAANHA